MCAKFVEPQFVNERDVKMVGPGHDDSHYITVPIKRFLRRRRLSHGAGRRDLCLRTRGGG